MIRAHHPFVPPNYKVKAIGPDGELYEWITYSDSEKALRDRLHDRGYEIEEVSEYDFTIWLNNAVQETAKATQALKTGKLDSYSFKTRLWAVMKLYLFELFDMKCAYCEARTDDVSSGDVEHFRPKNTPAEDPTHPGYYWLAYDPSNYLPSCERCNRVRGKRSFFPVEAGTRAITPDEIPNEHPLLLNPYNDDPGEHLRFLPADTVDGEPLFVGTVKGTTEKGEISVKNYNLNREGLIESRRKAQKSIYQEFALATIRPEKMRKIWDGLREGREEFSAAMRSQAEKMWTDLINSKGPDW